MEVIRQYIVSVAAAAILCGILCCLLGNKGGSGTLIKLIAGIFLALIVIKPLAQIELGDFPAFAAEFGNEAEAAAASGKEITQKAISDIIKAETEAYILDKAESLNAHLTVDVTLSSDLPPAPVSVRLTGAVSPYAKARLESILENDLGISKENQIWTG